MAKEKYPLQQVLEVKHDRVEKAERVVTERKRALEVEQEKLKKVEEERDGVKRHHGDKLQQLRRVLDEGTTSPKVQQMKQYLEVVKEKLEKEEAKVKEQEKNVKEAEESLDQAKEDLQQKRVEEEKIIMHKEQWDKEMRREVSRKEQKEHDELGTTRHARKKKQ